MPPHFHTLKFDNILLSLLFSCRKLDLGVVVEVFVGEGGEGGGGGGEEGVGDGADGVGAVVGVFAAGGEGLVLGGEGAAEGGGDGGGVAGAVEYGGAAEAALLAGADVDGGNAERGHLDDAAR